MLLWFVTWPTAVEKLMRFAELRDVEAWLLLRDRLAGDGLGRDVFERDPADAITHDVTVHCDRRSRGDCYDVDVAIEVDIRWPEVGRASVTLEPTDFFVRPEEPDIRSHVRIFRIDSASDRLPFSDYYAAFHAGETRILPRGHEAFIRENANSLRFLLATTGELHHPRSWNSIQPHLARLGFDSRIADELSLSESALSALKLESDPRLISGGVQVFGVRFSLGVFIASVGVFFAAIAFAMLGPVIRMRTLGAGPGQQPWILVLRRRSGGAGALLEAGITLVSIVWACVPVFVLARTLMTDLDYAAVSGWGLPVSAIGLVFSCLVFLWAAWEMRRCRLA